MSSITSLPSVHTTAVFNKALVKADLNPERFAQAFAAWKEDWPDWEDLDYYFVKDGLYFDRGKDVLTSVRHVHMPPEDPNNWPTGAPPLSVEQRKKVGQELKKWNALWTLTEEAEERGKRLSRPWKPTSARNRTSSRVLVYVDGNKHG